MWKAIQPILVFKIFDNPVSSYLIGLAIFIGCTIVVIILHRIVLKILKNLAENTSSPIDDFIIELIQKNILPLLYFGSFFLASRSIKLSKEVDKAFSIIGVVFLSFFLIKFVASTIRYFIKNVLLKKEQDAGRQMTIKGLLPAINVVIWSIGIIFLMDNLGFNISAMVAGLGIGGIAVAMAAQSVLKDLFSYFSILVDRPFVIGDFIILGDYMGTIEHIGLKTTRIRSLGGEVVILSNSDLTSSRVRNYKLMQVRRAVFQFGVVYNTDVKLLKEIPEIVKSIIEAQENTRFDRAHFKSFGDYSLDFEVVYNILSGDFNIYMDIQQSVNLELFEEFAQKGIEFAYPTQVVVMDKNNK